jgi:hypothetical protein
MRVLSQYELCRLTKAELSVLLHRIASELPLLPEGSMALRNAHLNLNNIVRRWHGLNSGRADPRGRRLGECVAKTLLNVRSRG